MLSDNATKFKGFVPQLKEFLDNDSFAELILQHKMTWRFIPAKAPGFGSM